MDQRTSCCEICDYNLHQSENLVYSRVSLVHFNRPWSAVGSEDPLRRLNFWEYCLIQWVLPLLWSIRGYLEMLCIAPQPSYTLKAAPHMMNTSEVALKQWRIINELSVNAKLQESYRHVKSIQGLLWSTQRSTQHNYLWKMGFGGVWREREESHVKRNRTFLLKTPAVELFWECHVKSLPSEGAHVEVGGLSPQEVAAEEVAASHISGVLEAHFRKHAAG